MNEEQTQEVVEVKKSHKWGLPFAIISFVISILSLFPGYLSILPFLGLAFAVITAIMAGVAIILGIVGLFGTRVKWPAIAGISISALMLAWGLVRYFSLFIEAGITSSSSNQ